MGPSRVFRLTARWRRGMISALRPTTSAAAPTASDGGMLGGDAGESLLAQANVAAEAAQVLVAGFGPRS